MEITAKHSNRSAIRDAMLKHLAEPGSTMKITSLIGTDGHPVPPRQIQITIAQVRPDDWEIFTRRDGEKLIVFRAL